MNVRRQLLWYLLALGLMVMGPTLSFADNKPGAAMAKPLKLTFRNMNFEHRWSKDGQNEFTPSEQSDLASWQDMLTLNVHDAVKSGEQLADVANRVVSNYQRAGKILRTNSVPATPNRPAEHMIAAVLGNPEYLEAVFARFVLLDGVGLVIVYSHRVYGKAAGPAMSAWLQANGSQVEADLMAWNAMPKVAILKQLPQSR